MFAIIMIYMMLFSFVFIIVAALSYLVYSDWANRQFHRRVRNIYAAFAEVITDTFSSLAKGDTIDTGKIAYIEKKLGRNAYEKVFQDVLIQLAASKENRIFVPLYIEMFYNYILRTLRIRTNGSVRHIQNVFMLGEYRFDHPQIINYLMQGVNSTSVIARFNSMSALSKIGNADALVKSLVLISRQRQYMNMKVLTDVLNNFEGDRVRLENRLIDSFHHFDHELKLLVISYFFNEESRTAISLFESYIKKVTNKEEHIRLLKYFGKVQHPKIVPEIESAMSSSYWEVRAIAAKALHIYTAYFTLNNIIDNLGDDNWYVRTNTAIAVLDYFYDHMHMTDEHINQFMKIMDDKYAVGAIEYARDLRQASKNAVMEV